MGIHHPSRDSNFAVIGGSAARKAGGVVLLVTLVVLVVLSVFSYMLSSRVAAQRRRDNYIIDYAQACYARDSAVKYALAELQDLNDIELVSRPNEPDFSDLFALSEPDYRRFIEQWAAEMAKMQAEQPEDANVEGLSKERGPTGFEEQPEESIDAEEGVDERFEETNDYEAIAEDFNDINADAESRRYAEEPNGEPNEFESIEVRGPYGPPWPYVTEPVEFEVGSAKVKVEIEDENAKYPLGWGILGDEKVQREAQASLETFCEWMGLGTEEVDALKEQLTQVGSIKPFKVDFKPMAQRTPVTARTATAQRRGTRATRTVYKTTTITVDEQAAKQARDFARLFHSSLVDAEALARPTVASETRKESTLKYTGMWGSTQVNINSAPRHVLEAAFTFGGDAEQIADEIIRRRRVQPFKDIDELKKGLLRYSTNIDKCTPYITATSNIFAVRITATSGTARASAVVVVLKQGGKVERIAVVCG